MNKSFEISNPAFTSSPQSSGFNLISTVNSFTSIFAPQPLEQGEEVDLQKLLFENFQLNDTEENEKERISQDFQQIKSLTIEIRAIQKQSLILVGERLNQVRTILRTYKEGAFTQWLKSAFKSKQTGYNILAFYEFYSALPSAELKGIFTNLPQKTAYLLASRSGNMEAKIQILQDPSLTQDMDLLPVIRDKLPLADSDKRKSKGETIRLLDTMIKNAELLHSRNEKITKEIRQKLKTIHILIQNLLEIDVS